MRSPTSAKSAEQLARELAAARAEIARLGAQLDKGAAAWDKRADELWEMQKRAEAAEKARDELRVRMAALEQQVENKARARGDPFAPSVSFTDGKSVSASTEAAGAFGVSLRRVANPFDDSPSSTDGASGNPFGSPGLMDEIAAPTNPFGDSIDAKGVPEVFATRSARMASVSPAASRKPPPPPPPRRRPTQDGAFEELQDEV